MRRICHRVNLNQAYRGAKPIADFLKSLGVPEWRLWILAIVGQRLVAPAHEAMKSNWFTRLGLVTLAERYAELQHQ